MKGRPPVPAEVRRLQGSEISHRPVPEPAIVGNRLEAIDPPDNLPEKAVDVWRYIVPILVESNVLREGDVPMLVGFVTLYARALDAAEMIEKEGVFYETQRGTTAISPAVKLERESWAELRKYAEQYGLTPSARTRLGLNNLKGKTLQSFLEE